MPFGESIPAPLDKVLEPKFPTRAGTARRTIALKEGVRIEPIICFESLFADDVRVTASSDPSVIALASNDGWFGRSSAAELHNLVSVFRAVENRRPVVIASNMGPSEIIDASGRVVARARAFREATVHATVRIDAPSGLYRRHGDRVVFGFIALLMFALHLPRILDRLRMEVVDAFVRQ